MQRLVVSYRLRLSDFWNITDQFKWGHIREIHIFRPLCISFFLYYALMFHFVQHTHVQHTHTQSVCFSRFCALNPAAVAFPWCSLAAASNQITEPWNWSSYSLKTQTIVMLLLDISIMKIRLTPLCLSFFRPVVCSSFLKRFCKILTRPYYRRCCILVIKAPLHLLFLRQDLVWLLLTRVQSAVTCFCLSSGSFCRPWMLSQLL